MGDPSEGINSRRIHIDRRDTCVKLFRKVAERGFVLLKAPPRSGKTALLQLMGRMVNQVGVRQVQSYGDKTTSLTPSYVLMWDLSLGLCPMSCLFALPLSMPHLDA